MSQRLGVAGIEHAGGNGGESGVEGKDSHVSDYDGFTRRSNEKPKTTVPPLRSSLLNAANLRKEMAQQIFDSIL
jgi:hypothetical protein